MYLQTQQIPPQYGVAAAIGSPLLVFGIFVLFMNRVLLGDNSRFVTHGGKGGFRPVARGSWLSAVLIFLYGVVADLPAAHGARDRLALAVLDRQLRHQHVDARQLARRSPTLPG